VTLSAFSSFQLPAFSRERCQCLAKSKAKATSRADERRTADSRRFFGIASAVI
jgi:hypothetical protein